MSMIEIPDYEGVPTEITVWRNGRYEDTYTSLDVPAVGDELRVSSSEVVQVVRRRFDVRNPDTADVYTVPIED